MNTVSRNQLFLPDCADVCNSSFVPQDYATGWWWLYTAESIGGKVLDGGGCTLLSLLVARSWMVVVVHC